MSRTMYLLTLLALAGACGRGATGLQGASGVAGLTGPSGAEGPTGANGIDATPVTVVKLCQGVTAYPATFTEVAFCVGGQLYGTYSANGGFSTLLPPGQYNSNGINSTCTFTVAANCQVTNP